MLSAISSSGIWPMHYREGHLSQSTSRTKHRDYSQEWRTFLSSQYGEG